MAAVIDSGPVEAEDQLRHVPREKWRELMLARRRFCEIKLSHDCRCLVEFVNDAETMFDSLGFESADAMIRNGYHLEPEEIAVAVEWLRLNPPDEPVSLKAVISNADIDKKDRTQQRPVGTNQHSKALDNKTNDIQALAPTGTSAAAALRRLRTETEKGNEAVAPIYERVLSGEITANAGMIEAGFRKKRASTKQTTLQRILKLLPLLTNDERHQLAEELGRPS